MFPRHEGIPFSFYGKLSRRKGVGAIEAVIEVGYTFVLRTWINSDIDPISFAGELKRSNIGENLRSGLVPIKRTRKNSTNLSRCYTLGQQQIQSKHKYASPQLFRLHVLE